MDYRWLGRPPRTADEVRRVQSCCGNPAQCLHCPLRPENMKKSLADLTADLMDEWK
ncbi:MAG: hypothetical protein ACPHID_06800 [Thermoplasmatota archaeon]